MEINLVVINVGNSRLAIGSFIAGELSGVTRIPNNDRPKWEQEIAAAWTRIEGRDNAAIVGASVNPPMQPVIEEAVLAVANRRVVWVGKDLSLPIKVLTDLPERTGVDRVLNVAAAYEQIGNACVVVDAGTAITVDCCNDQGEFLGGAIAPGLRLQLESLHEKTAALPAISVNEFTAPQGHFGRDTREAILQGVYHGIRGMVKELVENFATDLGRWPELIATGGDVSVLFTGWDLIHAVSPDLTLFGIALAYAEHHIRDDATLDEVMSERDEEGDSVRG
jgi:type III pantothenate kinase